MIVATEISSDLIQSKVGWNVPLTMYLVCHRHSIKGFIKVKDNLFVAKIA